MRFDYSKLRGLIVEKFGSISKFADRLGVAVQTISAKLCNNLSVTKKDILEWSEILGIDQCDIGIYFFTLEV